MINHQVYKGLCLFLNRLCKSYYEEGLSLIPDEEYDRKLRLLEEFEAAHPELIHNKSPTKKVGSLKEKVDTITHMVPMQSLKNALDYDELREQIESIKKQCGPVKYVLEPKYDGLACGLTFMSDYKHSGAYLVQAATRGDGIEGEDITRNIMLTDIVKLLPVDEADVRGELMLTKAGFKEINDSLGPKEKPFANARNAIAGLMRRKQLDAKLAKYIQFFPYEIVGSLYDDMNREDKIHTLLKWFGGSNRCFATTDNFDDIVRDIENIAKVVATFDFEIDGIVLKINDAKVCQELGSRSNSPRWAIAYKFPPTKSTTVILDFVWQVGRTGENAPVAKVAPTHIGGVVVDSALAHNVDLIKVRDWRIGDTVEIYRSGEVIPKLGSVDLDKRPADSKPLEVPIRCACCGDALEKVGPALFCLNKAGCTDQLLFEYDYIFSRDVLDVEDFSEKTIEQIVKNDMVSCAADFFDLTVEDFLKLDGFAEVSAKNVYNSFQKARKQPLEKVIQALCIPEVGASTSRSIALAVSASGAGIDGFFQMSSKDLLKIKDVGPTTTGNIRWCFDDPLWVENAKKLISKLQIQMTVVASIVFRENITDKRFVVSGIFPEQREHMVKTLELFGGVVNDSVSSKTDYLIAGSNPSAKKVRQAVNHGVAILDFNQYQALFKD